jgi:hypothetical protein
VNQVTERILAHHFLSCSFKSNSTPSDAHGY